MPEGSPVLLVEDLGQQRLPARSLAAVLARAGFAPHLIHFGGDAGAGAMLPVEEAAAALRPPLVVISQLFGHLLAEHRELAAGLRAALPDLHISMTGPLPTMAWRDLLEAAPALDSVLTGEAEAGILALAEAATSDRCWGGVPGLAWRGPTLVRNAPATPLDLDSLPLPSYPEGLPEWLGLRFATVEGSRGCWHRCRFCLPCAAYADARAPYRVRGVGSLADELQQRWEQGARLILFDDEQFLPPPVQRSTRVAELGRELAARGVRAAFTIKCRTDEVEPGLFARLRDMGLVRVYLGMESNCQDALDLFAKGTTPAVNRQALEVLDGLGLVADVRSLLIHPWSTVRGIGEEMAALRDLLDLLPGCLTFWEVEAYPGTPLAGRLRSEGRPVPQLSPLAYSIPDTDAEWFRRMRRLVLDGCQPYQRLCEHVTLLWFGTLLAERGVVGEPFPRRAALRRAAWECNEAVLAVLDEMCAAAAHATDSPAGASDDRAAGWSADLARRCALAGLALDS